VTPALPVEQEVFMVSGQAKVMAGACRDRRNLPKTDTAQSLRWTGEYEQSPGPGASPAFPTGMCSQMWII
jgi:hypothetical protein